MLIYLKELKQKRGETVSYHFSEKLGSLNWAGDPSGNDADNPVEVKVRASFHDHTVYITGSLKTYVSLECSRCLEPFRHPIESIINEGFEVQKSPGLPPEKDSPGLAGQEAADLLLIRGEVLDLREYLRQLFILAQDWKPLCAPGCGGICPVCGVNRNSQACSCREEKVDPRLVIFKDFETGLK